MHQRARCAATGVPLHRGLPRKQFCHAGYAALQACAAAMPACRYSAACGCKPGPPCSHSKAVRLLAKLHLLQAGAELSSLTTTSTPAPSLPGSRPPPLRRAAQRRA